MAFVFRSEKKSTPPAPTQPKGAPVAEEGEGRRESQGVLRRGLPHLQQKQSIGGQKENSLPNIQAHPIHTPTAFSFDKTVFKSRQFNDAKICQHASLQQPSIENALTTKEITQNKVPSAPFVLNNRQINTIVSKPIKTSTKQIEGKPSIINKNLLKTMMHMSEKYKETLEFDKIGIDETKEPEQSLKKNKFKEWKSLKRLSPLREHHHFSKFSQTAETNDINISCGQQPSKLEQPKEKQKVERPVQVKTKEAQEKDAQNSSSEDQYVDEATPGPGAYSYQSLNKKKQFRSKKIKFQKIFYSQIERFHGQEKKFQQVTFINDDATQKDILNKSSSICQSFLSKSPKFKASKESVIPPPGYYDTRQTLEHELVRNILRSSNTTTFINRSPRLHKPRAEEKPGPGAYTLDRSFEKLSEEKDKLSYSYKSQLERTNLYSPPKENSKYKIIYETANESSKAIHVKEDTILEDYYITEAPPFMSSAERFPQSKTQQNPQKCYQNIREDMKIPSPPKQAFNSSTKREAFGKIGEGVGIGLYNLNKDIWSKKSFNVLFN